MSIAAETEPHRENDGKKRRILLLLLLLLLGAVIAWFLFFRGDDVSDIPLEELLIQTRSELEGPGLSVAEAAENLKDETAVFEFVKEGVQYVSYAGRLQSPETVMRTRVANVADRAMFLAALLEAKSIKTNTVIAQQWPDNAEPHRPQLTFREPPTLEKLARKIGYDLNEWQGELVDQVQKLATKVDTVRKETDASRAVIEQVSGYAPSGEAVIDESKLEDEWVWVTTQDGNKWFDPSFPDLQRPDESTNYNASVPQARVTINARNNSNAEVSLLQWSGELLGKDAKLNFFPAVDTAERLRGSSDPTDIGSWFPLLNVGSETVRGEPFAMDGSSLRGIDADLPFSVEGETVSVPAPVTVTSLSINSISTENWPRVDLAIKADTQGKPQWVAPHFSLLERGIRKPVRIDSTYSEPAPVIVVADVTGSMVHDGKYEMIRKIGAGLVSRLNADQPLAVVTFGDGVLVKRLMSPFDPAAGVEEEVWQSPIGGKMDYLSAIERALNIVDVDLNKGEAARIVLVTDGEQDEPDSDDVQTLRESITARFSGAGDVRLFPIGVGIKDSAFLSGLAELSDGAFFAINPSDDPTALYNWLGNALSGQILVSYESQLQDAGNLADVKVSVEGSQAVADGEFTVPAWDGSNPAAVEIEISIGLKTFSRTVVDLGSEQSHWRLAGSYQIFAAPGPYPGEIAAANYLDNWLRVLRINRGEEPNAEGDSRVLSFGHAVMTNAHVAMTNLSLDNPSQPDYPLVYMNKSSFGKSADGIFNLRSIDQLRMGSWSNLAGVKSDVLAAGLASASAEAQLLTGAKSINSVLSGSSADLKSTNLAESAESWLVAELPKTYLTNSEFNVIGSSENPALLWVVDNSSGNVLPFDHSYHLISKGVNVVEVAKKFDEIDQLYESIGFWGGGAVSGAGLPFSQPFAGLIGFLRAQNKMWCYATVMMGYVANAIESEDALLNKSVPAAQAKAAELCKMNFKPEDFDKEIVKEIAKEWAAAWASDVVAGGIQDHVAPAAGATFGPYAGVSANSPLGQAIAEVWNGPRGTAGGIGAFISSLGGATVVGGVRDIINKMNNSPSPLPVTQNFHRAMAAAVEAER